MNLMKKLKHNMKVDLYNLAGKITGQQELADEVFNVKIKPEVVHEVYIAQMANQREAWADTKGKGEGRGGGKKPWKQKGTGRARHGSIRSPLWKGGGVTFGPTKERNFKKSVNQKAKQKALFMVLSDKVKNQKLILVEDFVLPEAKTKKLQTVLNLLPVKNKKTLIALDKKDEKIVKAAQNLTKVATEPVISLNFVDILKNEFLIMPARATALVVKHFTK